MGSTLKISGKGQGICLVLETMSEISGELFMFVSSINGFPIKLEKLTGKQIMSVIKMLAFIVHDGNRAHCAEIGEGLL